MNGYKITRSKRKTISIIVHKDASVEVRAPLKTKQSEIERLIISKQNWIDKSIAEILARPAVEELKFGSSLPFLGKAREIIAGDTKSAQITENQIILPANCDIKKAVTELLRHSAKELLPQRAKEISEEIGIKYSSLKINSAATHWGSCAQDRINLSCFLMLAEPKTIDYVIIHELTHIHHHNHSANFWAEVKEHCPNYIDEKEKLKALSLEASKLK